MNERLPEDHREKQIKPSAVKSYGSLCQSYDAAMFSIATIHQADIVKWRRSVRDRPFLIVDNLCEMFELPIDRRLKWKETKRLAEERFPWLVGTLTDDVGSVAELEATVVEKILELRSGQPLIFLSSFTPGELIAEQRLPDDLVRRLSTGTYVPCDQIVPWIEWRSKELRAKPDSMASTRKGPK